MKHFIIGFVFSFSPVTVRVTVSRCSGASVRVADRRETLFYDLSRASLGAVVHAIHTSST